MSPSLKRLRELVKTSPSLFFEELWEAPKAALIALMAEATQKNIIVITTEIQEVHFAQNLEYFGIKKVLEFPSWETLPDEEIAPSLDIVGKRLDILHTLTKATTPHVLFCPLQAALQRLPQPKTLEEKCSEWRVGDAIPFESIPEKLTSLGYKKAVVTSDKGEFSIRGGIVDLFPVSSTEPYRVEFFGDTIDAIRTFDPTAQKSTGKVTSFFLTPAEEKGQEAQATLLDYLGENTLLIFDEIVALEDRWASLKQSKTLLPFHQFWLARAPYPTHFFSSERADTLTEAPLKNNDLSLPLFGETIKTTRFPHPFVPLTPEEILQEEERHFTFLTITESEENKLKSQLGHIPKHATFKRGYLTSGFAFTDSLDVLFPMTELTHRFQTRRTEWRTTTFAPAAEFHVLTPGDLVVHFHSGIGKYLGTEKKKNHLGVDEEFLLIEYASKSKLFVPASQAYLVSRYIGSHEENPLLDTLGSKKWQRTKEKTQKAIVGYAHDLLHSLAKRELAGGFTYPDDSDDLILFEEDFPFTETPDQKNAITAIKQEMHSPKAMDRLLCGDVGYGKTEVAMRAAFKAVSDGKKQVAVLVPTTVLALQHFETFTDRMANYPVTIATISRLRTPKQIKETLEDVADGKVDILIGTHRLLSKDVTFKDLGLLIIDEEQRFGVRAKEHLKKLKIGVDTLSLSATPIPRTLYLSLIGARAISTINTPPFDRLPIKTIIAERSDTIVKTALERELARGGQAFFIHNRVETIFKIANDIQKLLPTARIVVGHGQMSADELDTIFHTFKRGDADILVATTIVESGVDIPNANTILIDRSDRFGLADLYQLKGRVGRWNRPAYAYFLVPEKRTLPEIVQKRLNALVQASGFGGGIKVAMRDLEIRGAGDILGTEQSGHVSSIGFHLYCKLLRRTIEALKNKTSPTFTEAKIETPFDARIPEKYVSEPSLRMELYHRFGEASDTKELSDLLTEIEDRFGPLPTQVHYLHFVARLRLLAQEKRLSFLKVDKHTFTYHTQAGDKQTLPLPRTTDPLALEKHIEEKLF